MVTLLQYVHKYICFALFFSATVTKKCTSCETERRHIVRFLFLRGLTTICMVGGLGVEDQQNGFLEVLILLHAIFGGDWAKVEAYR